MPLKKTKDSHHHNFGPITCWVCGGEVKSTDIKFKHFVECRECGSLLLAKDVKTEYPKCYYERGKLSGFLGDLIRKFAFWDRTRFLDLRVEDEILEVGFGNGEFVEELDRRGYQVAGVEESDFAIKRLAGKIGKENVFSEKELKASKRKFDLIVMFHVLEHVDNPMELILTLKTKLKPGGKLVIRVPNFNSAEARLAEGDWYHLDYPYHKSVFTDKGLIKLLKRSGLKDVRCRYDLGEYRQVLGDILLKKLGFAALNKYVWALFQGITIPVYWIWSKISDDFGVVEVQAK